MKVKELSNKLSSFLFHSKTRLLIYFAVFGPATITAISDNDAAGVATYSLAGAQFGYSILFILFLVTILLAITQEMGVRIATVTGKGLGDLIRERYGIVISLFVFLILFIANMGTIIADFAALETTASMFRLSPLFLIATVIVFSFLFISRGSYKTNQRLFLLSAVLYFSYVFAAFRSSPDWGGALKSLVIPTRALFSKEYIFAAVAVLGTTVTPWGQFFINSYIIDKKIQVNRLKYTQFETYFGAFLTNFFSFFMIVATAATLFTHKITLSSGERAALAIKPFAGEFASFLFGFGLLNAAIMGIIIISLSTAYAFAEFFGYVGSLDAPFERGKLFYGIFLFQLMAAAVIVMLPSISLFKIVYFTQSLNGLLLPFLLYFLVKITNNKALMGEYTNTWWQNYLAGFFSIIIVIASIFILFQNFIKF